MITWPRVDRREYSVCCKDFANTLESGTDNEGYGRLIYYSDGEWIMGADLDAISYCPWCGESLCNYGPMEDKK